MRYLLLAVGLLFGAAPAFAQVQPGGGGMRTDATNAKAAALGNIATVATGCNDANKFIAGDGTCVTLAIGTSSPVVIPGYGILTINGTNGAILTLEQGGTENLRVYTDGTNNYIYGLTNVPTLFYTNNLLRWTLQNDGGWFSNGATGSSKGNGTINLSAGGLYDNGTSPTGTGGYVHATSPSLVTPTIGVATATTVNKWTFTAPTTAATLTAGGDNQTYTMPNGTTTLVGTGTTQTLAAKTFDATNINQEAHEDSFTSNTSSGFTTITNLDQTFVAAGKYSCDGHMHFTTAPTTSNGVKLQLASDGTSSITTLNFNAIGFNGAAFATSGTGTATALGSTAIAASQAFTDIILNAEIVINVGGVIHVQFNENATSGTIAGNARWNCLRAS